MRSCPESKTRVCGIALPFGLRKVPELSKNLGPFKDEVNFQPETSFSPKICNKQDRHKYQVFIKCAQIKNS